MEENTNITYEEFLNTVKSSNNLFLAKANFQSYQIVNSVFAKFKADSKLVAENDKICNAVKALSARTFYGMVIDSINNNSFLKGLYNANLGLSEATGLSSISYHIAMMCFINSFWDMKMGEITKLDNDEGCFMPIESVTMNKQAIKIAHKTTDSILKSSAAMLTDKQVDDLWNKAA